MIEFQEIAASLRSPQRQDQLAVVLANAVKQSLRLFFKLGPYSTLPLLTLLLLKNRSTPAYPPRDAGSSVQFFALFAFFAVEQ